MSTALIATLIPDVVCLALLIVASAIDLRTRRIPNLLTFGGLAIGLGLNFTVVTALYGIAPGLKQGLLPAVAGAVFLFVFFLGFAAVKAVGLGDVKLMAAVGAFVRWPLALWVLAYVLLAGAGLAFVYAVRQRQLGAVWSNMIHGMKRLAGRDQKAEMTLHHMPYALGILLGTLWAVVTRYS